MSGQDTLIERLNNFQIGTEKKYDTTTDMWFFELWHALGEAAAEIESLRSRCETLERDLREALENVERYVAVAREENDRADAAESRLARAEAALEPFARAKEHFDGYVRDDDTVCVSLRHIRAHHVRAAARALSQNGEDGQ